MKNPLAGILAALAFLGNTAQAANEERPNIVFLFIDDWAWNGSPVAMDDAMENSRMPVLKMPNLERLAREGIKFRNAYASPQCSPSRVCVQTGQSSARNGFTVYLNALGQDYFNVKKSKGLPVISCISDMTLDPDAVTIPEALKPLGYVSAHYGKWHMRGDPGDEGYAQHDGDTNNNPGNTVGKVTRQPDDLTDPKLMFSVTERSLKFIDAQVRAKQPFYLQISHYAMHAGSECLPATRKKYVKHPAVQAYYKRAGKTEASIRRKEDPAIWLGMGEDLDRCIGDVLNKLKEHGIADNTYVVVMSDNGYRHKELKLNPSLTQPMHARKWWVWQGGIRVPMIVRGPGIKAGAVFEGNVVNYDLLPTFVDWAGGKPSKLKNIDGVSLTGYLRGKEPTEAFLNRYLYFHYPHNRTSRPHSAIVSGTHKVIHFYGHEDVPMLFDLAKDEAETTNLAANHPERHRQLFGEMMRYFKEVGARMPKVNPDFDPEAYKTTKAYEDRLPFGPFVGRRPMAADEKK
jgi:arylsulfatase A-like enzyme